MTTSAFIVPDPLTPRHLSGLGVPGKLLAVRRFDGPAQLKLQFSEGNYAL
jgi:hypothetical protein